jgi:amino acid permease
VGAIVSYFSGMLIVAVSVKTKTDRYEDMARKIYGKRAEKFVGILNIVCLICFIMSYIVFIKQMVPTIIEKFTGKVIGTDIPYWISSSQGGQAVWCTIFSYGVIFPMSLPRSVAVLRYSSLFGVLCSIYLVLAVMFVFFLNRKIVPSPELNWEHSLLFMKTPGAFFEGLINSTSLIIFGYMY